MIADADLNILSDHFARNIGRGKNHDKKGRCYETTDRVKGKWGIL